MDGMWMSVEEIVPVLDIGECSLRFRWPAMPHPVMGTGLMRCLRCRPPPRADHFVE